MTDNILPLGDATAALALSTTPPSMKGLSGAASDKTAEDFEAMFATQLRQPLVVRVGVNSTFGGGHGEEMMRSFLTQEYGKMIAKSGRLGIATQVKNEMLRAQEGASARVPLPASVQNAYTSHTNPEVAHVAVQ